MRLAKSSILTGAEAREASSLLKCHLERVSTSHIEPETVVDFYGAFVIHYYGTWPWDNVLAVFVNMAHTGAGPSCNTP